MDICSRGIIWEAQLFDCTPFRANLQVTQCFQCYKYGHIAEHCKGQAMCGGCGGTAHGEGRDSEKQCPQRDNNGKFTTMSCVNCGGKHTAWDRKCKVAMAEKARVDQAYATRPRQFETGSLEPPPRKTNTAGTDATADGWRTVFNRRSGRDESRSRSRNGRGRGRGGDGRGRRDPPLGPVIQRPLPPLILIPATQDANNGAAPREINQDPWG